MSALNILTSAVIGNAAAFTEEANFFDFKFASITTELPYNPLWANGTGYYNGAVAGTHAVKLAPGEQAKSVADGANARKLIFTGTALGTIVVFQRYTGHSDVITFNASNRLEHSGLFNQEGRMSDETLTAVLGGRHAYERNIGQRIEKLRKLFTEEGSADE